LVNFYKRFVKDFRTLVAPLIEIVKKFVGFKYGKKQKHGFNLSKEKLISTLLLSLPEFTRTFEIECDTSWICNKGFLM
jgi:hypothetical protein